MALHFFSSFFSEVDARLALYVQEKATAIVSAISPIVATMLGFYVVMWGISIAYGKVQEPVADGVWRIVRVAAILGIGLNLGYYNHYVTDVATGLPDDLTKVIAYASGAASYETSGDSVSALDQAFDAGWDSGKEFWKAGNLTSLGNYILAVIVWFTTVVLTGYAAFLLLLSKIAISVLLALGPIYVCLVLFQKTEKFFDSWLSQVVNFMLIQVIAVGMLSLILDLFKGAATGMTAGEMATDQVAMCVLSGLLGILVMMQVTSIASGISGGATLSTQGAFGMAMKAMGKQTARAVNNSPVGTRFERGQRIREGARGYEARTKGKELYERRQARGTAVNRAATAAGGAARSAATSGAQRLAAMRDRLKSRDDRWGRTTISNRDP